MPAAMSCGPRSTLVFLVPCAHCTVLLLQQPGQQVPWVPALLLSPTSLLPPESPAPMLQDLKLPSRERRDPWQTWAVASSQRALLGSQAEPDSLALHRRAPPPSAECPFPARCDAGPPQSLGPRPTPVQHSRYCTRLLASPMSSHQAAGKRSLGLIPLCFPLPWRQEVLKGDSTNADELVTTSTPDALLH